MASQKSALKEETISKTDSAAMGNTGSFTIDSKGEKSHLLQYPEYRDQHVSEAQPQPQGQGQQSNSSDQPVVSGRVRMGSEEDPREYAKSQRTFSIIAYIVLFAGLLGIVFMMSYLVFSADPAKGAFSWNETSNLHIITMLIFLVFFQGCSSIIYRAFQGAEKLHVKLAHGGIHLCALIGVVVALSSIISYKNNKGDHHFVSMHSWLGLTAIILFLAQYLGGLCTFLLPFAPGRVRAALMPYHKAFGLCIFVMVCVTAFSGMNYKNTMTIDGAQICLRLSAISTAIFAVGIVYLVSEHSFRRRPRPEGDILLNGEDAED